MAMHDETWSKGEKAIARRALRVQEPAVGRIRQRGMCNHDLPRIERARIVVLEVGPDAKEGDLESERAGCFIEPAGDVPPFDPEIRVASFVPGKLHPVSRHHLRERSDS